jgi:hypothetical protein
MIGAKLLVPPLMVVGVPVRGRAPFVDSSYVANRTYRDRNTITSFWHIYYIVCSRVVTNPTIVVGYAAPFRLV